MIIDISPLLEEAIAVWPGDIPFKRQWQCQIKEGANIDLSSLSSTVHIGAHADAPSHYHKEGQSIDQVDLEPYLGMCYVIEVDVPRGGLIGIENLPDSDIWKSYQRILFKTSTFPDPKSFNEDFAAFSPKLIEFLAKQDVKLIGIDTPSFDLFNSKDLESHQQLMKYSIRNLEGLILKGVEQGPWELIALPLKLAGFDASPVRAVLRKV